MQQQKKKITSIGGIVLKVKGRGSINPPPRTSPSVRVTFLFEDLTVNRILTKFFLEERSYFEISLVLNVIFFPFRTKSEPQTKCLQHFFQIGTLPRNKTIYSSLERIDERLEALFLTISESLLFYIITTI